MRNILICARRVVSDQLVGSALWREGIERHVVDSAEQGMTMAVAAKPSLIVVDRDLPRAETLMAKLRADANTKRASVLIVADGEMDPGEMGLLDAGANAVLRLPPTAEWDQRVERLLSVPTRKETRVPVHLDVEATFGTERIKGQILNLSVTGMLIESITEITIGSELGFSFHLHGFEASAADIKGRAWIVRLAGPNRYGAEFVELDGVGRELLRRFALKA